MLVGTPLAFLFSLIGMIRGIERKAAIRGLVISGALGFLLFVVPFLVSCLL
jgi:hypothetical protein